MNLYSPVISGSLTVTGSTSFIGNVTMTGTVSATASNAELLSGTGSVGFTTTGSFATMSGSVSSRVSQIETVYATTGSNSFRATQSITGSLTVTGQIIAQTINVQQVTSSIVYSSGSNVFGCDLNSRQTFTGSFYQTGSVAYFSGCVGVGSNSNNGYRLEVTNPSCTTGYVNTFYGLHTGNNTFTIRQFGSSHPTAASVNQIGVLNAEQHLHLVTDTQACIDAGTSTKGIFLRCGGNVGIGTQSPGYKLDVQSGWINNTGAQNASGFQYQNSGVGHTIVLNANNSYAQLYTTTDTSLYFGTNNDIRIKLFNTGETCFKCAASFCSSTFGIMGFGEKVFDKICYIMTTTGTICVPLDGLVYGSGPTRAIYLYGTLLDNDAAHYAHMLYFYRNDYGGLQASTLSQASLVHPSTAGQAYTFSVNDPVGIGKSACTLLLRFTSSGAGFAPGSYCTKMRIVVYNVPANA